MEPFHAVGSEEGDADDSGEEKRVTERVLREEKDRPGCTWRGAGATGLVVLVMGRWGHDSHCSYFPN